MVWLHGGGFVNGSGNAFMGGFLARTARSIVVTVNYRLGPLGWLALPSLAAESDVGSTGNYGLMDSMAALGWVRRNIDAFGGDPGRVTVIGQSAGGEQVFALLASPLAEGLFDRAISMSAPAGFTSPDVAASAAKRTQLLSELTCSPDDLACLRRPGGQQVIAAAHESWNILGNTGLQYSPTVDGVALPGQWVDLFRQGKFHRVPVLVGHTKEEGRLFTAIYENDAGGKMTPEQASRLTHDFFPGRIDEVAAEYRLSATDEPGDTISEMVCDALWATGLQQCCEELGKFTSVFHYHTFDPDAPESHVHGRYSTIRAGHDSDLAYLFQWDDFAGRAPSFTSEQHRYAVELGRYFGQFADTGDPNGEDLLQWPSSAQGGGQYLEMPKTGGTRSTPADQYSSEHRIEFWRPIIHPELLN